MPHDPYKGLYIHVPFCVSKCGYCDFASLAVPRDHPDMDAYLERTIMDIRNYAKQGDLADIETIYIGGGTPTYLGSRRLSSLLYALSVSLDLTKEGLEFTIEANPESVEERLIKDLWALGINRISIGVQSFDDNVLSFLGRAHDSNGAHKAIEAAHERFENVSIDLMCGIPGFPAETFYKSLETAINAGVTHISVYPLSIEEHTPFFNAVMAGLIDEPDDDMQAEQMERAREILSAAGFARYEIANYAKPGFESRHNCSYWTGKPYLGIGPSATTMTQNDEHRMRVTDGTVSDSLDRPQMEAEDLMLGMRLAAGISDERLRRAQACLPDARTIFEGLERDGLVVFEQGSWRPTSRGWLLGNEIFGRILDMAP